MQESKEKRMAHIYTCFASTAAVYSLPNASSVIATSSRMMLKSRARSVSSLRTSRLTCWRWVISCDALNLATTLFNTCTMYRDTQQFNGSTIMLIRCTKGYQQSDSQTAVSAHYTECRVQVIITNNCPYNRCTLCLKKGSTKLIAVTLSNLNGFSKFFHWLILQEIRSKVIITDPTTP